MNGNSTIGMPDDMGEERGAGHIWLRYATQFSVGERTYTIDMGIPVPVGADEETRERLLREADEGMDQLAQHVEQRAAQVQAASGAGKSALPAQKSAPAASTPKFTAASATPTPSLSPGKAPAQGTASVPPASPVPSASSTPSPAQNVPVPAAPTRESSRLSTSSQAAQSRPPTQPTKPEPAVSTGSASSTQKKPVAVPPTRQNIGASMPPTPGLPSGTLQLPQFLQYIQEMGLNARQAMDMLKVKSLSGLNLRDALERLQDMVMNEGATGSTGSTASTSASRPAPSQTQTQSQPQGQTRTTGPKPVESNPPTSTGSSVPGAASSHQPARPTPTASSTPSASQSRGGAASNAASAGKQAAPYLRPVPPAPAPQPVSPPSQAAGTKSSAASQSKPPTVREERPPYPVFDEEDEELEDFDFDEEDEDEDAGMGAGIGLSAANRGSAEDIVSGLREVAGSSVVSTLRLKALHNVIDGQVTPEQLQALIRGVWGVASDKKLKSEQAEALISWGKQDEFVTEAEMVLALFEEDGDARSDR